ncbi:MAG: hypothetical protein COZ06_24205 [Armatimonadetes bacterium CG_4_10_14_3_um_filter_66_18]|nr:hypothetical protein [Armatimonadota bacterium]PIU93236.1 MAG: hypothetical protein COS65_13710 [Armatimonadetes bacterium CG06_land_8_20_14_3_00_66_21]PIX48635.1 MAG: hypothetical protein COZ57_05125 [Armatimonadetes bacterium CG_4_8_14_3_um_filter_66_20]PIY42865.1 MAG: hypothetical protein COZ06_24205 [Armatimonadetes bacterium CG_4_10_14_3_um_filter_66_18]PIZ33822.1 MAG: hypothetical protein COY42_29475 [Armatimonadetes bacterium CG_4_10_14_0_8_um_filter_66_14]PJB73528.1 MAG: hypothetica
MDRTQTAPAFLQEFFSKHLFVPLHGWAFVGALLGTLLVAGLLFFLLSALPPLARRRLMKTLAFVAGLFYAVEFFWPEKGNPLTGYLIPLGTFLRVMGCFAIGLGLISLCTVHGKAVGRRSEGWINSAAFFAAFFAIVVFGFWQQYGKQPVHPGAYTFAGGMFHILFIGMYNSLEPTMFSILAFFITSAAYRAFRVKSAEASLMLGAAFIVMLGQVPVGMILTSWIPPDSGFAFFRLEKLANWILTGVSSAAFRGILFGTVIGNLALSLRTWLSLEKGAYFDKPL